jgi:hypothetical protein
VRWADERYVRIYTRDTPDLAAMGWEARALLWEVFRKMDRAGILQMGKSGHRGLAALVSMPFEVTERALAILLEDGVLETQGTCLVCRNFMDAQECSKSDAGRQRDKRERDRVAALSQNVTAPSQNVTPESRKVTDSHEPSRDVTPYRADPVPSKPTRSMPEITISAEPACAAPALVTFPCSGKPDSWGMTECHREEWVSAYPGVDVIGEARKALAWVNANPTKRKTARGMAKFLLGWMGRVQDRGGNGFSGQVPAQQNLRVGHVRAEDFKHDGPVGEVKDF